MQLSFKSDRRNKSYKQSITETSCAEASTPYSSCCTTREATTMRSRHNTRKSNPCSVQLEKACTQQRRPTTSKNKFQNKKKGFFFQVHKKGWALDCENGQKEKRDKTEVKTAWFYNFPKFPHKQTQIGQQKPKPRMTSSTKSFHKESPITL